MTTLPLPPSVCGPSAADDIIKMGVLRKGKKGKKRFFVLRQDSYMAPASIDCYESERRFRQGASSKMFIKLKDVFNLNKTVDGKMKHCVGIFARDETLKMGCENEQDQEAWLQTLFNVYMNTKCGTPEENLRQNFDYCWDVVIVKDKGLTEKSPSLSGNHRFCLNSCSIYLYKKKTDDPCLEFPLVYISNYGHKNDTLYLRVGRSAVTGPGELWMQTEDAVVAQHIHETMKSILEENHELRQRSASTVEPTRRQSSSAWTSSRANSTVSCGSGSFSATAAAATAANCSSAADRSSTSLSVVGGFNSVQQPQSRTRAISESEKTLASRLSVLNPTCSSTMGVARKVSAPVGFRRHRTESESSTEGGGCFETMVVRKLTSPNLYDRRKVSSVSLRGHLSHLQQRSSTGVSSETLSASAAAPVGPLPLIGGYSSTTPRSASHSPSSFHPSLQQWAPPGQSPLTTSPANLSSTDSVASASTTGDHDRTIHWQMSERTTSLEYVGSQPTIVEEGSGSGAEYLPMQPPMTTRNVVYPVTRYQGLLPEQMETGPDSSYVEMNTADKVRRMTADSGYMEMTSPMKGTSSASRKMRLNNTGISVDLPSSSSSDQIGGGDGYTPMGPSSLGRSLNGSHSRQTSWHLEEVRSYISDSDSTCSSSVPPSRAYSLGSKPTGSAVNQVIPSTSAGPSSSSYLNKFVLSLADDRKRAHSVGSWNKQEMKGSASLVVPHHLDQSNFIRQRSESFGSGRSTPGSRRFTDSSKRSNQSEDLVEMDFGTSPGMGRSPSGSLGSAESLNRSRTGSVGNSAGGGVGNKMFWSPKVEQINEQELNLLQSPSSKFIQQRITFENTTLPSSNVVKKSNLIGVGVGGNDDYAPMETTTTTTAKDSSCSSSSADYSLMGGATPTFVMNDYVSMDTGSSKSDYVIMNSRQKFNAARQSSENNNYNNRTGQDLETSSGYSSTGDCSTVAETVAGAQIQQQQQQKSASSPSAAAYSTTSPKILVGQQPTYRFHDVQGEEELMRRLARVEMSSPKHSPPSDSAETYVNLNFGAKNEERCSAETAIYENMNLKSAPPVVKSTAFNLTVQQPNTAVKRSHSLNDRGGDSSSGHQRKLSENQPPALKIVPAAGADEKHQDKLQHSPKSPKSRSPIMKVFSSFGKGQVKIAKPSSKEDSSASASSNTPVASPLPQRLRPTVVGAPTVTLSSSSIPSSSTSPIHIEYASLDLNSSSSGKTTASPKVSSGGGVGVGGNGLAASASPIPQIYTSDEKEEAVLYAQIDVTKSEGLKKAVRQC